MTGMRLDGCESPGWALASGDWEDHSTVIRYRSEWLGDILVERATLSDRVVVSSGLVPEGRPDWIRPGCDLVRFWLTAEDQVIVKAFDKDGENLGYCLPVTTPLTVDGGRSAARTLYLGLEMDAQRRVTVTGEYEFDSAVSEGILTRREIEYAETRIRQLTAATAAQTVPPALVRNFTIIKDALV